MSAHDTPAEIAQVADWIDDLAGHEQATERLMAMGPAALEPLAHYLERGPQTISQPRVFALRMLARLHDPRVPVLLRRVLHEHPLHALPPHLAESEYRVKDAAIEALVQWQGHAAMEDVAFAVRSERLPAAVLAAGRLRMTSLLAVLAGLLSDDVLAAPAQLALTALQPESVPAVAACIHAWMDAAADTTRTRLGLVRGFHWLAASGWQGEATLQQRSLRHASALVRAAAALSMQAPHTEAEIAALVHGVLGSDGLLALACRERLRDVGDPLFRPATNALRDDAEPDVYGNLQPARASARRWVLLEILRQTAMDTERFAQVSACVAPDELAAALLHWDRPEAGILWHGLRHPDARVRAAAVAALGRADAEDEADWLAALLGDADPAVRRQAYQALCRYVATGRGRISRGNLPPAAWWHSPWRCARLLLPGGEPRA